MIFIINDTMEISGKTHVNNGVENFNHLSNFIPAQTVITSNTSNCVASPAYCNKRSLLLLLVDGIAQFSIQFNNISAHVALPVERCSWFNL